MGLKQKLTHEMHRYVEKELLPCAYEAARQFGADCTDGEFVQRVHDLLVGRVGVVNSSIASRGGAQ